MEQIYQRSNEIFQSLHNFMNESFKQSCCSIQKEAENQGNQIWNELKSVIGEVLQRIADEQETARCFCPTFLQDKYISDISFFV